MSQDFISLRWFAYPQATRYRLTRNGTEIFTGAATSFKDTGLAAATFYEYMLSAEISGVFGTESTSLTVQALLLSRLAICPSEIGVISMDDYEPSTTFTWQIKPNVPFYQLTLNVSLCLLLYSDAFLTFYIIDET